MIDSQVAAFFEFARKRHQIWIDRFVLRKPPPWTDDPILGTYRFTNVFRELDRTTVWFRENVRERMRGRPEVLLATVVFRWFNRIESCRILFNQNDLMLKGTPFEIFLETGDASQMRDRLRQALPKGPYVTGAYMIRSPTGMDKLDGMLHLCERFWCDQSWKALASSMLPGSTQLEYNKTLEGPVSIETFTNWLQQAPGQGPFLAYEVACDLLHTDLLCSATDRMTWANPGPGAQRGLNRLSGRTNANPRKPKYLHRVNVPENQMLAEMRWLLGYSRDPAHWSAPGGPWFSWDMRTVEHTLCEFDKYERARLGEGKPKQLYRPPTWSA